MNYEIAVPSNEKEIRALFDNRRFRPFEPLVMRYISSVSDRLLNDSEVSRHSELIALGFWMRNSSIKKLQQEFERDMRLRYPRGLVFHIAPSNIDTIFVYSWFLSMLCGNSNIVRISRNSGEQIELLLSILDEVLQEKHYEALRHSIRVVRYGHDDEVSGYFSDRCNMRVIWGGDETIKHIRKLPIPATAIELTFADKFSLSVIDVKRYQNTARQEQMSLAQRFYNDVFVFLQNGCSSPRALLWFGESNGYVVEQFWSDVENVIDSKSPDISDAMVMDKWIAECSMAIESNILKIKGLGKPIQRVKISSFNEMKRSLHCGGGLFYEMVIDDINSLHSEDFDKNIQTISYFGIDHETWVHWLNILKPLGVDRIVPIGQALEFSKTWDGFELLESFTRKIELL